MLCNNGNGHNGNAFGDGRHCMDLLRGRWEDGAFAGVGLDSNIDLIARLDPSVDIDDPYKTVLEFNTRIIEQTHRHACVFTMNEAPYKALGEDCFRVMRDTIQAIRCIAPKVPVVLNICAGDVPHINHSTIKWAFEKLDADGITLQPLFGEKAYKPFLDLRNRGIFVLSRTSNEGAEELQDIVERPDGESLRRPKELQDIIGKSDDVPFHRSVAWRVSMYWNGNRNCGLLIGPTSHGELAKVREIAPDIPIFVTGIGPQTRTGIIGEDDIREIVVNGSDKNGTGFVVCSSRGIIFSPHPDEEIARLSNLIDQYRLVKA